MSIQTKSADLVVALTGASGAIYCIRLLEALRETPIRTHLVMSKWGIQTLKYETSYTSASVRRLADECYSDNDLGAPISSGSFQTIGMVILPCSAKSLGSIAHGHGSGLIQRAADVVLKERRKLVLDVRETPLNLIHLRNLAKLAEAGAPILPAAPSFYNRPQTIDDLVDTIVARTLQVLGIEQDLVGEWKHE